MELSKADLKTYNFVEKLVIVPSFIRRVRKIRVANKIPIDGFPFSKFDEMVIKEKNPRIPAVIKKSDFISDIKNLLQSYNLGQGWVDFFSDHVLFNYFGDYFDIRQFFILDLGGLLRITMTKSINSLQTNYSFLRLNFLSLEKLIMNTKQP